MAYSSTRFITKLLNINVAAPYMEQLLVAYVNHLGIVLQRMIVNKRAVQEHMAKNQIRLLANDMWFMLNHMHKDTIVEQFLCWSAPAHETCLDTLLLYDMALFERLLNEQIKAIFSKVQSFVQNKAHPLVPKSTVTGFVYTQQKHIEVYAVANTLC